MLNYFDKSNWERIKEIQSLNKLAKEIAQRDSYDIKDLGRKIRDMIDAKFLTSLVNYELNQIRVDNDYFPLNSSLHRTNILDCKTLKLDLGLMSQIIPKDRKYFKTYPQDIIIIPLGDDKIEIELFEQYQKDQLLFKKKVVLKNSESLFIQAGKDIIRFKEKEEKETPFVFLLSSKKELTHIRFYNPEGISQEVPYRNLQSYRLESVCELMGKISGEKSIQILEKLSISDDFNIRWYATKNLILLSKEKGIEKMIELLKDKNPLIRQAAKNYLKK